MTPTKTQFNPRILAWIGGGVAFVLASMLAGRLMLWALAYRALQSEHSLGTISCNCANSAYQSQIESLYEYIACCVGAGDLLGWIGRVTIGTVFVGWCFYAFRRAGTEKPIADDYCLHRPTWYESLPLGWRRLIGVPINFVVVVTFFMYSSLSIAALVAYPRADDKDWMFLLPLLFLPALELLIIFGGWVLVGFKSGR